MGEEKEELCGVGLNWMYQNTLTTSVPSSSHYKTLGELYICFKYPTTQICIFNSSIKGSKTLGDKLILGLDLGIACVRKQELAKSEWGFRCCPRGGKPTIACGSH